MPRFEDSSKDIDDYRFNDIDGPDINLTVSTNIQNKPDKQSKPNSHKEIQIYRSLTETNLLKDPKLMRRKATNDYELPASDRESWWRCTIKETPSPLKYKMSSFLTEALKKPNTYRFKSDGRKHDPVPQQGKGKYLLPGAYSYQDFGQRVRKINLSYGFKNEPLDKVKNKQAPNANPNLGPFSYETENYLTVSLPNNERISHSFFKSQIKRNLFPPKQGPSPGEYTGSVLERDKQHEITSCFKSESGRFNKSANGINTPGPGQYEPISAWINSKQSQEFNQKGVFFTTSAKVIS